MTPSALHEHGGGGGRGRRGFTMLELVVVLALLALVVGLVLPSLGSWSRAGRARDAVFGVQAVLLTERAEAMRRAERRSVELLVDERGLSVKAGEDQRAWDAPGLRVRDAKGAIVTRASAEFDGSGRTGARRWTIEPSDGGGTLWAIEFDPVSGAAELRRGRAGSSSANGAGKE